MRVCCRSARLRLKRDRTRTETRFRLSPKRTSPFKSAGASVQSIAGSRGVRISVSYAGYTTFRGSARVLATHSIRQFPLHFPSHASPCAIRFQTLSTSRQLLTVALKGGGGGEVRQKGKLVLVPATIPLLVIALYRKVLNPGIAGPAVHHYPFRL